MGVTDSAEPATEAAAPDGARGPWVQTALRVAARLVIAAAIAVLLGAVLWARRARQLSPHTNILGYPTYNNYVFSKNILAYRVVTWELPLVTAAVYALLTLRGPLRRPAVAPRAAVPLVDEQVEVGRHPLSRVFIVVPPAGLLAIAACAGRTVLHGTVTTAGVVAGLLYAVGVFAVAAVVGRLLGRRGVGAEPLELVNAVGCILVAIGGFSWIVRHTFLEDTHGTRQYWRWFPVWALVLSLVAAFAWMAWRLRSGWSPSRVERSARRYLLGASFVFVATEAMVGSVPGLQGFDDMQSVTGAGLLSRGYFPWRDFFFIHGLFEDALRSSIGFVLFQHTFWGAAAGTYLVVVPVCWVSLYLLGAWSTRRGGFIGLAVLIFGVWDGIPSAEWMRFVALPVVFILLGEAIRRPRLRWTVLLAAAVFVDGLLVPESSFQAVGVLLAVVGADLVHRDPELPLRQVLRRTAAFVGTGAALGVVWAAFLAANHALKPFVQYYVIFGPGHDAAGAVPPSLPGHKYWVMFTLTIALVVLTIGTVTWRLVGRGSWTPRDWVTAAAAVTAGLYQEKALGRFDLGHLMQTVGVALSLWTLWGAIVLDAADGLVVRAVGWLRQLRPVLPLVARTVTVAVLAVTLQHLPLVRQAIWHLPGSNKNQIDNLAQVPLIGYSLPNATDPTLLPDLQAVMNTYAGRTGTIYDNTNALGYFYYLLGRPPATSFLHVSMAQPEYAQRLLINQLRKSRPAIVAFDDATTGLPSWDGLRNNVRHFQVAQYLLDGWTPLLRSHTVLFLLRNDLVAHKPALPALSTPPQTQDLYFSNPSCDWGDTPNFLDSHPTGAQVSLPLKSGGSLRLIQVGGWAYDVGDDQPVRQVVVTVGSTVVGKATRGVPRPDVAATLGKQSAAKSGFQGSVNTDLAGPIGVYAVLRNGTAVPLHGSGATTAKALKTATGGHIPVGVVPVGGVGSLDGSTASSFELAEATLPASVHLASYQLAQLRADGPIGNGSVMLADNLSLQNTDLITANTLAGHGNGIAVRVGSCLQWHGYTGSKIYVLQTTGTPVTSLTLSGVRD